MPNTKRDTTKRTRDKSLVYWAFGLILLAIALLVLGRVASNNLSDNSDMQRIDIESNAVELYTDEIEAVTGAEIQDASE